MRGDALADRLRLADVDHAAARVAEQVDAGLVGQRAPLLGQLVLPEGLDGHSFPQLRPPAGGFFAHGRNPGGVSSVADDYAQDDFLPIVALLLCAIFAAPAQANFKVGMADQDAAMFDNAELPGAQDQARPLPRAVRLVQAQLPGRRGQGLHGSRAAPTAPTCSCTSRPARLLHERPVLKRKKSCRAPSVEAPTRRPSSASAREFPRVKTFGVWNEGNHVSQPTSQEARSSPRSTSSPRARLCRSCKIVAADVLDRRTCRAWLSKFKPQGQGQGADLRPAQLRRRQPQAHVRARRGCCAPSPGEVWLTETGGILKFLPRFPRSETRQAKRDEVHVQAGRQVRHAPQRHALARSRGSTTTSGPASRAQRALRRRAREPERLAAQGLQAVQAGPRCALAV